jgi:hypothetical protein
MAWEGENLGTFSEAYTKLKITLTGICAVDDSNTYTSATYGRYWTSNIGTTNDTRAIRANINTTATTLTETARGNGNACRCIKD